MPPPSVSEQLDRLNGETIAGFRSGRFADALRSTQQAADLCRAHLGPDSPRLATTLNNLGAIHRELGDLPAALRCLSEAVDIDRRTRPPDDPALAVSLNELGRVHKNMGSFAEAEALYQESLDIRRRATGERSEEFVTGLNNLALLYDAMGDYARAEPLLRQALALAQARSDVGEEAAETVNNLAGVCFERGNYGEAETLYRAALVLLPEALGPDHPRVALAMQNLGAVYRALRNHTEAGRLYAESARRLQLSLGEGHPLFANALNSLGIFLADTGQHDAGADTLAWALAIRRDTLGPEHPDVVTTLVSLGSIEIRAKQYDEARRSFEEARLISLKALGHEDPLALQGLAGIAYENGRFEEAETLNRRALDDVRTRRGSDHPDVALGLQKLGLVAAAAGRHREALDLLLQTGVLHDRLLAQVFGLASESHRLQFLGLLQWHLDFVLSLAVRHLSSDADAVGAALDLVLRRKGLSAEALAAQRDAVLGGKYPHLEPKLRRLTNRRRQTARARLEGAGQGAAATQDDQLREWEAEMRALEEELAREIPEVRLETRLRRADRGAVALALPDGTALVEFVRFNPFDFSAIVARGDATWGPPRYAAFVLPAGTPGGVRLVDLGEADSLDRLIATFRAATTGTDTDGGARDLGALAPQEQRSGSAAADGLELYARLFDPLVHALGTASSLVLSPDGDLSRLPFEVLPAANGTRIVDRFSVSYVGCGRDVLRWNAPGTLTAGPPVVTADPDFDFGEGLPSSGAREPAGSRGLRGAGLSFGRLPGTRSEGERIAELLGSEAWLGEAAMEGRLKRVSSPLLLHIATHGYFLPTEPAARPAQGAPLAPRSERLLGMGEQNPLLRSGLALAAANTWLRGGAPPGDAEDGILTAEDVTGLDLLATELVVLSACETGLGEVHRGEGVFGLQRAFTVAGARTLIMSLWKVPDEQTGELMATFYRALLAGRGRAEALRDAQLHVRERWPDPFYWGAFVCQGNPAPLPAGAIRRY